MGFVNPCQRVVALEEKQIRKIENYFRRYIRNAWSCAIQIDKNEGTIQINSYYSGHLTFLASS